MIPIKHLEAEEALKKFRGMVELKPREAALIYCRIEPPKNWESISSDLWHSLGAMNEDVRYANDITLSWQSQNLVSEKISPREFISWIKNNIDENWPENPIGARPAIIEISGRPVIFQSPLKLKRWSPRRIFPSNFKNPNISVDSAHYTYATPQVRSSVTLNEESTETLTPSRSTHTLDKRRAEIISATLKEEKLFDTEQAMLDLIWYRLLDSIEKNPPIDVEKIKPKKKDDLEIGMRWGLKSVNRETIRSELRRNSVYMKMKKASKPPLPEQ
ncbi:hypothetical protein PMI12_04032 [Variovorax sp. CF313]|nr:hypothetical protein PMI12_04032 [Variovorax sp. CF313]